ncbi:MAG: Transcriptional regulator, TetR family [Anaerolinea thermophila]|uniref:Transcriptional regulator, TetR family n=1 Tax=Anaerolinea thermophila TaxID=167964 RepID=A0A117LGZ4_9CHLR|nr:MAG: Transcriptional regulator, TetR family [Anaerolinea thermophila]
MEKTDRRSERSRRLITSALLDLLTVKRFNEITIQEITDQANVGRATFYLHYRNKEECLIQVLTSGFDSLVNEIEQMNMGKERDFVDILEKIFQFTTQNRKLYMALLSDNPHANIMADVQKYIREKMVRAIPISKRLDPPLRDAITTNLTGALIAMVLWWLREDPAFTSRQIAEIFVNMAQDGLRGLVSSNLKPLSPLQSL